MVQWQYGAVDGAFSLAAERSFAWSQQKYRRLVIRWERLAACFAAFLAIATIPCPLPEGEGLDEGGHGGMRRRDFSPVACS
jgi:hypothetical protein